MSLDTEEEKLKKGQSLTNSNSLIKIDLKVKVAGVIVYFVYDVIDLKVFLIRTRNKNLHETLLMKIFYFIMCIALFACKSIICL